MNTTSERQLSHAGQRRLRRADDGRRPGLGRRPHPGSDQCGWPGREQPADARDGAAVSRMPAASAPAARPCGSIDRIAGGRPLPPHLRGAVIALGNFDGFHLGHQAVIGRAVQMARERGVAAIVGTFDPHPVRYFGRGLPPFRLTSLDQRQRLFAMAGVDAMVVFEFDDALAAATPEEFVQHWLAGAGGVVTGEDFNFGRRRAGNVSMLAELGRRQGLACDALAPVPLGDEVVSSTRIRAALKAGDCAAATRLLTRPFAIECSILPGDGTTQAIGLRAALIDLGAYLRPRRGLYAVRGRLPDGRVLGGVLHLGACSGLSQGGPPDFLRLFDLESDLCGQRVEVEFLAHVGEAMELDGIGALRARIGRDGVEARQALRSAPP